MKRREFNKGLASAGAVILSPLSRTRSALAANRAASAVAGVTPVISFPNGFANTGGSINFGGDARIIGSDIVMMANNGHNAASAWFTTSQPPNAFTTQFTFEMTNMGSSPTNAGMTFGIQNTTSPPGYPGHVGTGYVGDANMCGMGGAIGQWPPVDSVCIKFDASSIDGQHYVSGTLPSSTGMYFNGGPSVAPGGTLGLIPYNDLNPSGINFYQGHTYQVTIVYDGAWLTMVILDTTSKAQARLVWPLNLANTTNPNGNYVGFTGGTASNGTFYIHSWSYWSGYNPRLATPSFSLTPGQYSGTQTVTISYPPGSTCYYTTTGLLPTSSSTQYTTPLTVSTNTVIQAVAIQSGSTDSLVATGAYQINTPNVINFPNGFSAGNLVVVGYAYLSGSAIRVSDLSFGTSGAAWFPVPVTVSTFATAFTVAWGGRGQGMCFVLQNNPPLYTSSTGNTISWSGGPTAVGGVSNAMGYGGLNSVNESNGHSYGLLNSVAIAFNQFGVGSDPSNGLGLYTNGANPYGSQISTGLDFSSGHPFAISVSYSGNSLAVSIVDTVTGAKFAHNFTVDIPSTVGANTAYAGFTGGTGGAASIQAIQSWTYTASSASSAPAPAVPAAPTNLKVQ